MVGSYADSSEMSASLKQVCFEGCAQTLPDAIPPIDKITLFSKTAVLFYQWVGVYWRIQAAAGSSVVAIDVLGNMGLEDDKDMKIQEDKRG